eukprot:CAMPEP_0202007114 /NCGR_PEP_ID=MMETSP0905-20130828/11694_1 /ASSEMBLY_ACC=CAM_ASM_000554 /TAXON_ID=420261 /ORGANISM="Thalassiosira antarctica, Strain CCMP982" /LENGTH=309 /DNA_ID=CAMNT_0048565009 /DNA_START=16 /DNA_END=947 /DNA_ORIENTATION=+
MGSGSLSYYEALGIERNALSNEIRDAYKKQSLALHPDKNVYGASMMKLVNEAYRVLYDEAERARYDREDRGNRGSNSNGQNSAVVRSLKLQLAESEHKRCMLKQGQDKLKKKVIYLQDKVDVAREEADVAREELSLSKALQSVQNGKNKHLQAKLHYSGQEQKRIENEADYLKSENDLLERESQDHKRRIDLYENKVERSSRALREERLKSSDDLARAEEKAKEKLEHAKTLLLKDRCATDVMEKLHQQRIARYVREMEQSKEFGLNATTVMALDRLLLSEGRKRAVLCVPLKEPERVYLYDMLQMQGA